MVLQNKHKARASRRYNAARGGISDTRGRGSGSGRGSGRGRGSFRERDNAAFPSLNPDDDQEEGEEDEVEGEGSSSDEDKGKYSRRKIESNAWRYREEEIDPHAEGEAESEPEVDLSGLLKRVAKLDSSRTSKAQSSQIAAEASLQADVDDIDQSLVYLLDRQRERERSAKGGDKADLANVTKAGGGLSASEIKLLEMEGKKLLEERENQQRHYGRAQMLKTQNQQSRVKSINIGDRRRVAGVEEQKPKNYSRAREKVNVAALYDDDDYDDDAGKAGGGLEDFLQELDQVPKARAPLSAATSAVDQAKQAQGTSPAAATILASPSQRKEHEDFLDSII